MPPRLTLLLLMSLILAPAAYAQEPQPACLEKPQIAEPWTNWTQNSNAIAGYGVGDAASLPLGQPRTAQLHPVAQVQYPVPPGKPPAAKSFGGLFRVNLARPARVGIGLSGPAWVDVVAGEGLAPAIEHGHGLPCSGIAKIVWFDLPVGASIVAIAGAPDTAIRIMAADSAAP
ncbi:hypothetical protein BH10PSE12_BH10PSE12_20060 [soil metagenome]